MKLKNFLLGSLCMVATTASAQFNGTGYYVVKSNSGKYLSVEGNTAERVDGYFKDLKLNDAINSKCVMYIIGEDASSISDIKVGEISAVEVISQATNLGTNAKFAIEATSDGKYTVKGYNTEAEVYLKEGADGKVGTKGSNESGMWEIMPYTMGDANGDGGVTLSDLNAIRANMAEMTNAPKIDMTKADLDGDGILTINDLNLIKKIILSQEQN